MYSYSCCQFSARFLIFHKSHKTVDAAASGGIVLSNYAEQDEHVESDFSADDSPISPSTIVRKI